MIQCTWDSRRKGRTIETKTNSDGQRLKAEKEICYKGRRGRAEVTGLDWRGGYMTVSTHIKTTYCAVEMCQFSYVNYTLKQLDF